MDSTIAAGMSPSLKCPFFRKHRIQKLDAFVVTHPHPDHLGDPVMLRQALVNLLDNATDAVAEAGMITVSAKARDQDVIIEVVDTGVGLPTEDAEMLLQPFFSTKGGGSGMGLALVHRIVSDHGGTLELENGTTGGAVARMVLNGVGTPDHDVDPSSSSGIR